MNGTMCTAKTVCCINLFGHFGLLVAGKGGKQNGCTFLQQMRMTMEAVLLYTLRCALALHFFGSVISAKFKQVYLKDRQLVDP